MTEKERLSVAMERARRRLRGGIGTQSERLVHSTLKYYLEPDENCHEVPVGSFVADVFQKETGHIIEIQSRGFDRLREKLAAFLPEHPVTVVHPVVRTKYLCWVDAETGEVTRRRKSPKTGRPVEILREIYRLPEWQSHPNLTFMALMLDVEEYRLLDGYSRDLKKGSHRLERLPLEVGEAVVLKEARDYANLLPKLPEEFTRKELAKAAHIAPGSLSYAAKVWERSGSICVVGKRGREYVYRKEEV